jgi:hypothetical protein
MTSEQNSRPVLLTLPGLSGIGFFALSIVGSVLIVLAFVFGWKRSAFFWAWASFLVPWMVSMICWAIAFRRIGRSPWWVLTGLFNGLIPLILLLVLSPKT